MISLVDLALATSIASFQVGCKILQLSTNDIELVDYNILAISKDSH